MKSLDFYLPQYNIGIECEDVIKRDKNKFDVCKENGITIIYYTSLLDKISNNEFYNDKIIFNDVNNLFKILESYETTN